MLIQTKNDDNTFRSDPLTTPGLQAIFINTVPAVQALTISNESLAPVTVCPDKLSV